MKNIWRRGLGLVVALNLLIGSAWAQSAPADGRTPPDMPTGAMPADGQTPPDMPTGAMPADGQMPPDKPAGDMPGSMPDAAPSDYAAAAAFGEDVATTGETYASTAADENAVLVNGGANVSLNAAAISRDSAESTGGDAASFYGVGAAALVTDGTLNIAGSTITTDAAGGAGAFAYGDGTLCIADSAITTAGDTSGGIHAAGGGKLYAWNLDVTTQGASSAAIRSDRGGGTMVVDGGSYVSNGSGSPAVYCTADIAVNGAALTANGAEGICIEGKNNLNLFECDLTANMPDDAQNDNTWSVIVYQSMSGDSQEGLGTLRMVGGSLTSKNGGLFYTTNTQSNIVLVGVDLSAAADSEYFLRCTGNANRRGWGESGANGADCTFTAISQQMAGDVIYDSISNLNFYITGNSSLTGAFADDESCAGAGGTGTANVYIDASSTWTVSGDSAVTNLYCQGTIVDASGNAVSIIGRDGTTYVEGDSAYSVTVESYADSCDLTGAGESASFADFAVDKI